VSRLRPWWPLALLTLLAAALRLSTLDLQSLWYDEAFTPVHVLHPSLGATLRSVVHTENTPPLWYILIWAWSRLFGTGAIALRLPSALAGVATVPVAWGTGRELAGRRAALVAAGLVAVDPLFVWYSQEGRAYALFVLLAALAMLCFLRAESQPTPARLAAFAASGAAALLTHYFAVFLLIPMALWLLRPRRVTRSVLVAVGALAVVGVALVPLILAQGGHGTQWIGEWPLSQRVEAIPQYYLTGYTGAALGHGIELLVALPILAGVGWGLWRTLSPRESDGALLALAVAACGILIPLALALGGADYLAPRNVVAAMIPVTATIAVICAAQRTGRVGLGLAALTALGLLAISVDVDLSPRLQRGDWRNLAQALRTPARGHGAAAGSAAQPAPTGAAGRPAFASARAIVTVELGAAPFEYYLPPLHNLQPGAQTRVREIDEVGYAPLRAGASESPAPGFRLLEKLDVHGLIAYRFVSRAPQTVSETALRAHAITLTHAEVLVAGAGPASIGAP
jgi:mannosyltransferase